MRATNMAPMAAELTVPLHASGAQATPVAAGLISSAPSGRESTITNRPSRLTYHHDRANRTFGLHAPRPHGA